MSAGATRRPPLRAGYLGHLTLVANRMEGAAGRRLAVRDFLEASPEWQAYAAGPLQVCVQLTSVQSKRLVLMQKRSFTERACVQAHIAAWVFFVHCGYILFSGNSICVVVLYWSSKHNLSQGISLGSCNHEGALSGVGPVLAKWCQRMLT